MVDIKAFNEFCVEQICSSCPYYRKDSECWAEWAYQQGRADAIDEFYETKTEVMRWLLKRQGEGYGTTLGELLDYIYDYKLKEQEK